MKKTLWTNVDTYVKVWLKEAGKRIVDSFTTELKIGIKADKNDLVTNLDKETEQYFAEKIRAAFPTHKVLGEEGYGDEVKNLEGIIWMIDPIDGTMNFVHQQRNFFISIGIYENGKGQLGYLYDVVHDELYSAQVGEGAFLDDRKLPMLEEVTVEKAIVGLNATWLVSNSYMDPTNTLIPLAKDVRGTGLTDLLHLS